MAHSFKTSMGGKTFKVFAESSTSGAYTYNKKAQASYCNRNKCPINVKVGSQSNLILYNNAFLLNASKSRCIRTLEYDNTELYVNLISKLDLPGNLPIITDLSGQAHPVKIDASNNPLPPYLTYDVDPSGVLFGDTICGINNYVRFMVYDISANVHHHVVRERSEIPVAPEPVAPTPTPVTPIEPVIPTPVTPIEPVIPTPTLGQTTFTLVGGKTQTTAATSGILTVPSSIPISNLMSVSIGTDVTSIPQYAFYNAINLTNISLSNTVTSIGVQAFFNTTNLPSISIPFSVTTIEASAFESCGLKTINFDAGSKIISIPKNAFYNALNLTTIISLPNTITSIGDHAFYNTTNLTSISIPFSVTTIEASAFEAAIALSNVKFDVNSKLKSIEKYAFYNTSKLESITIPSLVTKIDITAFQISGLKNVIFESPINLETLKVSIGSNPTFFGSGPVTIIAGYSTGPSTSILYPPSGIYPMNL